VAVRGGACLGGPHIGGEHGSGYLQAGDWQASLSYRWLHSDRHFVGDQENKTRFQIGNEVINDSHFFDLSALYAITERFNVGLTLPFVHSYRTSWYEHDNATRHGSSAGGLGDVRAGVYAWIIDPAKNPKGNLSVGIGPKFPTGDYRATDTFYTTNGPVIGYVDQSIQPGDGGWGFTTELFGFYSIMPKLSAYVQGSYLFNPENDNGTPTRTGRARGNPFEQTMSIPDQYLGRAGLSYILWEPWGVALSLGGRIEGVPVRDALGDSDGFRRPGYAISIEPGLSVMKNGWTFGVTTPVAVYRNRERSVADERFTATSGVYRHGDAAFADFIVTANIAKQF